MHTLLATLSQKQKVYDKIHLLQWPISIIVKHSFSRQNFLSHGKTIFLTAKLSFSRQNILSHGKTLSHDNTFFLIAKLSFLMAKRSVVEYNIRSEEKTCSGSEGKERYMLLMREMQRAPLQNTPPLGSSRKYMRLRSSHF